MPMIQEPNNLGDLLKYEAPNLYSREQATIAAGQKIPLGTVMGWDKTNNNVIALAPSANNGSEVAIGVLACEADSTDTSLGLQNKNVLLIVRHAVVASHALIWPAVITAEQKETATQQLSALGVLIRTGA